ncbi:MAG: 3-dehydroquinate synthase [Clostridiales bacterium]|jgi:3-dehydroquinate synthase|nr:3-dehydroquinate synthase [Clostridiales bacterium]
MKKLRVNIAAGYDIIISKGALDAIGETVSAVAKRAEKIAVICDDIVDGLYSERVMNSVEASGKLPLKYVFKNGEASKNAAEYIKILEFLGRSRLTRTDAVIALGGGVTGDMAGFAAATYLRGITLVQAPTTLLAAVDSSVGGKTGINLSTGKNLAGCFFQPSAVVCDLDTLKTLSDDLIADGMGEIIKHAVLKGGGDFDLLSGFSASADADFEEIIARSVKIKRDVVQADERESNLRKLLNLGHTVGHAVEKLSEYKLHHGKCVAIGLAYIAELSFKKGFLQAADRQKIFKAIENQGIDAACPYSAEQMAKVIAGDKKVSGKKLTLVMIKGIGDCFLHDIETREAGEYLSLA